MARQTSKQKASAQRRKDEQKRNMSAYNPPFRIKFKSDNYVLEFQRVQIMNSRSKTTGKMIVRPPWYWYRYVETPSRHPTEPSQKIGTEIPFVAETIRNYIIHELVEIYDRPDQEQREVHGSSNVG